MSRSRFASLLVSLAVCLFLSVPGFAESSKKVQHVLLISVDGLHAVDLNNFVAAHPSSTLAQLAHGGVTFVNAYTSRPSDSFPGILALTTGGTPNSTGIWYDDSYDRTLTPPLNNFQAGLSGSCTPGQTTGLGTEVLYDETVDVDLNQIDGGGGIDPQALPRDPANNCVPVYPHQHLRVNTIFEVIKAAGGRTAWADKHLSYELLNGPSGHGLDDLYTPEIAALGDATRSIPTVEINDELKVQAILNEIAGFNHTGTSRVGVPAVFGMNFQSVSVGQKLPVGGYLDAAGTPTANLQGAMEYVDGALGRMVAELRKRGLFSRTLIIVTAKHGQSPIDRSRLRTLSTVPGITTRPSDILGSDAAFSMEDDISLNWLVDHSTTAADVGLLESFTNAANIQTIYSGPSLTAIFNDPTVDPRVPDIIVQPVPGTIYTHSTKKIAEHGGFAEEDRHVALVVSMPDIHPDRISTPVETRQVAPTILESLGLDPQSLQAVQMEHTHSLPGVRFGSR